jgi:putative ABC transport system permease protein
MLLNYLRSAWRTIRNNKLYSLVNIGCLAIGIAVCMTILLFVLHEHSYDRWQANSKRIFLVNLSLVFGDSRINMDLESYPTAPMVRQADANVAGYLRVCPSFQPVNLQNPAVPEVAFTEKDNFLFADSNFFSFFSFPLKKGSSAGVLQHPYSVVLTERAAKKYFGTKDPIGRALRFNGLYDFQVTGIAADPPSNTSVSFDFIASVSSMASMKEFKDHLSNQTAGVGAFKTWLLLRDAGDAREVAGALNRIGRDPWHPDKAVDGFALTALPDMHLNEIYGDLSMLRYLRIFPLVAGLVLLLALINYISLATARSAARAKEVGVRKVMGAGRGRIAAQFYVESAIFAVCSFAAGILLFLLLKPWFLRLLQLHIDNSFLFSPVMLAFTGILLVLVTLAAGSYPSLVLSAFKPVAVLYGKFSRWRGGERVRKGFIVIQFTISMSLILCSLIIEKELYYLRHTDTGMNRENVVMVPFSGKLKHYDAFKHDVAALPGIRQAATAHYPMYKGFEVWEVPITGTDKQVQLHMLTVDNDFIGVMGLQWKEKAADVAMLYDGKHLLLNEAAVNVLNFSGDPVGQKLHLGKDDMFVAGVLQDFNYQPMQEKISPMGMFVSRDTAAFWGNMGGGCLLAKINAHVNIPTVVESIRKTFSKYDRQTAFEFEFMDEAFDAQYKAEDRLAGLLGVFTGITILIACLGLFALATFSAQQRVKEIGIRKTLGASAASIGSLLSKDFLRPVVWAILIACPLSWWLMDKWLNDFAYRTPVAWWIFPAAGALLLVIALATVLTRSLKAAKANPADALRGE